MLDSLRQRTDFKLSLAKTTKEKSEVLEPIASLLAYLVYREVAELDCDHILSWLFMNSIHNRNFIFGSKSVGLLDLYTDVEGSNVMHVAALRGLARAVGTMISLGFKESLDARGRRPMDLAIENGKVRVIFMLMENEQKRKRRVIWSWKESAWRMTGA